MALITGSVQSEFHGLACGRHETTAITNYPFLCHVFFVDCVFVSAVGQAHSFGSFSEFNQDQKVSFNDNIKIFVRLYRF
jgi:hypothetical protein